MRVGVFGGTFDPFTHAHYEIVKKVLDDKLVDNVIVIPTIVDYYRAGKTEMFDLSERKEIIQAWFDGVENVVLDFHEYKLACNTSTYYDDPEDIHKRRYWHMLEDIKYRHDKDGLHEFFTIIGGDSWNNLSSWYNYEKLLDVTKFIVVKRDEKDLKFYDTANGIGYYASSVVNLDKSFADVSATEIRRDLRARATKSNKTIFDLYLEDIEKCKEKMSNAVIVDADEMDTVSKAEATRLEEINRRLIAIGKAIVDPYKDSECKYSIIEDIMKGRL